jgi:hypothetical protein
MYSSSTYHANRIGFERNIKYGIMSLQIGLQTPINCVTTKIYGNNGLSGFEVINFHVQEQVASQ